MLSCSIWFSAPSFWMGGGLENCCVGRMYGADGVVRCDGTIRTTNTTYAVAVKITTHSKTRCRKPYAATQHLMLLMMSVCTRNKQYINKITLLHQVGVSNYFMFKRSNHYSGEFGMKNTEEINLNCKAFDLYSEGKWFLSELGHRIQTVRFLKLFCSELQFSNIY